MTNERLILAIGQMERAVSRIEAAQTRLASQIAIAPDTDLAMRHQQLKSAASQALAGMDALLAGKA